MSIHPQSIRVENDSLHIHLTMDLNDVKAPPGEAYIFTPVLQDKGLQLALPPVIVAGSRRARFDRRERALSAGQPPVEPYCIVVNNRKLPAAAISYHAAVPYAAWMRHAVIHYPSSNPKTNSAARCCSGKGRPQTRRAETHRAGSALHRLPGK